MTLNFDQYKDDYSEKVQEAISFIGQDLSFFTESKANDLLNIAERHFKDPKKMKVLDVGCGVGLTDRYLVSNFDALYGVDISKGVIKKAIQNNPSVNYQAYDSKNLPFSDESFDLAFTICVIQCIPPDGWVNFIDEMKRVVKRNGLIVVFEHNPFNLLSRYAAKRFDANALLLSKNKIKKLLRESKLSIVEQRNVIFFPFRGRIFKKMESAISWLPLGAQYYVAAKKMDEMSCRTE